MARVALNAIKIANLQPVKKIHVEFDPFHEKVRSVRQFLFAVSGPKTRQTNPSCALTTKIRSDRAPPLIDVSFGDGSNLTMKPENLNLFELMSALCKHCDMRAVAPVVQETSTSGKIGKVKKKK